MKLRLHAAAGTAGLAMLLVSVHLVAGEPNGIGPDAFEAPTLYEVHVRDPSFARLHPDSQYNFAILERTAAIQREIWNFTKANENGTTSIHLEDLQREKDILTAQHVAMQNAWDQAKVVHERQARLSGSGQFLNDASENHSLLMDVVESNATRGYFILRVGNLATYEWIDSHSATGKLEIYDEEKRFSSLRFAGPTMRTDLAHGDGYSGNGALVAVLDDSVRGAHINLMEGYQRHAQGVDTSAAFNGDHGTQVAGVVNSNHGTDTGAAPSATLYDIQVAECCISGQSYTQASWVESGLALMNDNSFGIHAKLGVYAYSCATHGGSSGCDVKRVDWFASEDNILLALPAGNDASGVNPPCTSYNNICVGATFDTNDAVRANDYIDWYSSTGPSADGRLKPDVAAPGTDICTTDRSSTTAFTCVSGTSFAAPAVIGIAALLDDHTPGLPRQVIKAIIIESALNRATSGLWDGGEGWGYVNANTALNHVQSGRWGSWGVVWYGPNQSHYYWYDQGDTIGGTMTWKRYATSATCCQMNPVPEMGLRIFDPQGQLIAEAVSNGNNLLRVEVASAPASGYYSFHPTFLTNPNNDYWINTFFSLKP